MFFLAAGGLLLWKELKPRLKRRPVRLDPETPAATAVSGRTFPVRPHTYRRPDPTLYSQPFLRARGFAVTWDNPDIHLERNGVPVPSSALRPDTTYDVVADIWNGSARAPAINLRVEFSFLSFGIGTARTPIGHTTVMVPVKGASGLPVPATVKWHTPKEPGHYCLQIELQPPDDAEFGNNLGQENTNVIRLNSPTGFLRFPVHNDTTFRQELRLEIDTYELLFPPACDPRAQAATPEISISEMRAQHDDALERHGQGAFPVPPGWTVLMSPETLALTPGETQVVDVSIVAPDDFDGRQTFNINALEGNELRGGITFHVEGNPE